MLEIRTLESGVITDEQITTLNTIAARGFGYTDAGDVLEDTRAHISHASVVQITYSNEHSAAFALYKERLWRSGY
ncbi:hypothetical protein D3C72_1779650 [compost metagenome]